MQDRINHSVVVFDGVCNLCNFWVDWVLRRDRKGRLKFASLQGDWASRNVPEGERHNMQTILYFDGKIWWRRSDAALRIGIELGGIYGLFGRLLLLIPVFLRDLVYDFVAARRYAWFGRRQECRVPTENEKIRFL